MSASILTTVTLALSTVAAPVPIALERRRSAGTRIDGRISKAKGQGR